MQHEQPNKANGMQTKLMHAYSMQDNISMQQYEQQLAYTMQMATKYTQCNEHGIHKCDEQYGIHNAKWT